MQAWKCGLANLYASLIGARDERKVTPGITELSRPRVHLISCEKDNKIREISKKSHLSVFYQIFRKNLEYIDGAACYIDVGSNYPGSAEASKGAGVHRLKGSGNYVASLLIWQRPIKRYRELGSERCEAVCLISTVDVWCLRGINL